MTARYSASDGETGNVDASPATRDLVERHIFVDADVRRQSKHAFGDDVAQKLVGTTGNPIAGRAEEVLLEREFAGDAFGVHQDAAHVHQVHAERTDILLFFGADDFGDRIFGTGRRAARQR